MIVQLNAESIPVTGARLDQSNGSTFLECSSGAIQGVDESTGKFLRQPQELLVGFDDGRVLRVIAQLFGETLACLIIKPVLPLEQEESGSDQESGWQPQAEFVPDRSYGGWTDN